MLGVVDAARASPTATAASRIPSRTSFGSSARATFDNLLVPPLDGAVAFEEVDQSAVLVADQLHFDVLGALDELLQNTLRDAERGPGFAARRLKRFLQLVGGLHDAHPAPAAAHRGLHDYRIAQLLRQRLRFVDGLDRRIAAGEYRNVRLLRRCRGRRLVAELLQDFRTRADERDAGVRARPRERRVLGKEAVAG